MHRKRLNRIQGLRRRSVNLISLPRKRWHRSNMLLRTSGPDNWKRRERRGGRHAPDTSAGCAVPAVQDAPAPLPATDLTLVVVDANVGDAHSHTPHHETRDVREAVLLLLFGDHQAHMHWQLLQGTAVRAPAQPAVGGGRTRPPSRVPVLTAVPADSRGLAEREAERR